MYLCLQKRKNLKYTLVKLHIIRCIDKLQILGSTHLNKPMNFKFADDKHEYKYTSVDSQLLMTFNNKKLS